MQKIIRNICLFGLIWLGGCAGSQQRESCHSYLPRDSQASSYREPVENHHQIAVENHHKITKVSSAVSKPAVDPLEKIVDISRVTHEMPFSEAIDVLRSTEPKLNIVVIWNNLEKNGIYRNTPIGIDGISGLTFRHSLNILLSGVLPKLSYDVDGNVITIATEDALQRSMTTKVYSVGDMSGKPADFHTNLDELNKNPTSTNPSRTINQK